jgi:hypothetical protein
MDGNPSARNKLFFILNNWRKGQMLHKVISDAFLFQSVCISGIRVGWKGKEKEENERRERKEERKETGGKGGMKQSVLIVNNWRKGKLLL